MTLEWLDLAVLIATALFASLVAGVTGGGVTVILLPVLVLHFGIQVAMPIITIALLAASISRVAAHRRHIDLSVVGWFTAGAFPLTVVGTYLFTISAPDLLTRILGGFLVAAVVIRRLRPPATGSFAPAWFLPIGAVFGFLTGISAAVGAVLAPFYLGYGLRKEAYVGTLGLNVFIIQLAKLAVFARQDFLQPQVVFHGLLLVPFMVLGTLLGKRVLAGFSEGLFVLTIEAVMVLSGLNFLIRGG